MTSKEVVLVCQATAPSISVNTMVPSRRRVALEPLRLTGRSRLAVQTTVLSAELVNHMASQWALVPRL